MRMVLFSMVVALAGCKPTREEQLGKVLRTWDGAKCAAFLSERGWKVTEPPEVDSNDSVTCVGERHGERVILGIVHFDSNFAARDMASIYEAGVGFEVKVFGTVGIQFRQSAREPAEALRDACVTAGRFDLAGIRDCLSKEGWTLDECRGEDDSGVCEGSKKQVYGRMTASVDFGWLFGTGEETRSYESGFAHWRKKPHNIDVIVGDYDATRAWMLELEKAVGAP